MDKRMKEVLEKYNERRLTCQLYRIISLGKCSKYYLYILGTIFFRCLKDCIFGFVAIDPESKIGLFGFIPKISGHYLLQDFYKYLSFIFGAT